MDWFPIVFIVFKVLVLGTGMFFAIKWHHDQGKKKKKKPAGSECPPAPPCSRAQSAVPVRSVRQQRHAQP